MSDELRDVFRANLVRLLRDELEKAPAFTIEDLCGNDTALGQIADAILAAPLTAAYRPPLTVVPEPQLELDNEPD